ncbi:MAG: hypothetical protein DI543_00540 [Bradyrhizobium icense]|nr:MAG: hypothetical protein DI543_00540 [Bradyrhizobium icense]
MLHIDGFEEFANDPAPNAQMVRAGYEVFGSMAIVGGRLGTHGVAGRNATMVRKMPWTTNTMSTGFAHMFDTRGSACWLKVGDTQVNLWMNPDTGLPYLNDKKGGALPVANRWYYYELELDRSAARVTLSINNRIDMTYDVEGDLSAEEVEVGIGYILPHVYRPDADPVPVDNATKTFDDFYIRDTSRFGPIVVSTRFPTSSVLVEWFKANPTLSHPQSLAERPPKPLDNYVAANVIDTQEIFQSNHDIANDNPVIAQGVVVLARKAPTLDAKLGVKISSTAQENMRSVEVGEEWETKYLFFENASEITRDQAFNAEFGIYVAAP